MERGGKDQEGSQGDLSLGEGQQVDSDSVVP